MKLSPPPRQKVRVYELARELGWTSRQTFAELSAHGEFVKSAASQLEAPIVRAIRQEFGAVDERPDPEAAAAPAMYGQSAKLVVNDDETGFAEALAKAESQSKAKDQRWSRKRSGVHPILQVLLDEIVAPQAPRSRKRAGRWPLLRVGTEDGREAQRAERCVDFGRVSDRDAAVSV